MTNRPLTGEEKRVWHHFTQNVQTSAPLQKVEPPKILSENVSTAASSANMPVKKKFVYQDLSVNDLSQMDKSNARKLRRGHYQIEATLDLHGYTVLEAMHEFHQFLIRCAHSGKRVICVVTGYGKMNGGKGLLKADFSRWVNFPENRRFIISYNQARPEEGGHGAFLLRLKRKERL